MRKIRKSLATILVCLLLLGGLGAGGAVWFIGPERSLDYLANEHEIDLRPWFYEPWYETEPWERPAPSPWQGDIEAPAAPTPTRVQSISQQSARSACESHPRTQAPCQRTVRIVTPHLQFQVRTFR